MLQFWQYAILSEIVYRRSVADFDLNVDDIDGVDPFNINDSQASLLQQSGIITGRGLRDRVSNEGFFINPNNGFTALVTTDENDNFQITFRGTDTAGEFSLINSAYETFLSGSDLPDPGDTRQDEGDLLTNRQLARGQVDLGSSSDVPPNQWQTARVLVEFIINELADNDASRVSVAGQSLGGGLAGLAAATYGLEGTIFGPAPFANQLEIESLLVAHNIQAALQSPRFFPLEGKDYGEGATVNMAAQSGVLTHHLPHQPLPGCQGL